MFTALATVGAASALASIRICNGGTVAKPKPPSRNSVTIAGTAAWAVNANTASTTTSATSTVYSVGISARSANLPPTRLPSTGPTPNSTSSQLTALLGRPATSVIMGAM